MNTPPKVPRPEPAPLVRSPVVDRLAAGITGLDGRGRAEAVRRFWARHASAPVIEADSQGAADHRVVTFLWRDAEAAEVLLFANRITDERRLADSLMRWLPGTDVWWLALRMRADWRASYAFLVRGPGEAAPWGTPDQRTLRAALDGARPDPRNPMACLNRAGVPQSVVALPAAPPQPWLRAPADVARGGVSERVVADRRVWVYEPARTAANANAMVESWGDRDELPLVVAFDGEVWTRQHSLPTTLDAMIAAGALPPVRALLIDSGSREQRWRELADGGDAPELVADRLLPALPGIMPAGAASVVAVGQSLGGVAALQCVLRRPRVFGGAVAQSPSLWLLGTAALAAERPPLGARIELQVGSQEWVLLEPVRAFAAQLRGSGVDVRLREVNGGHDYAWWRGSIADGLADVLGADAVRE